MLPDRELDDLLGGIVDQLVELKDRVGELEKQEKITIEGWTDYSATSTIVGWSSYVVKLIYYLRINNLVYIQYRLTGTSNSATVTFTLPFSQQGGVRLRVPVHTRDSGGALAWGYGDIPAGSNTITIYSTAAGAGWTASGTKETTGSFVMIL